MTRTFIYVANDPSIKVAVGQIVPLESDPNRTGCYRICLTGKRAGKVLSINPLGAIQVEMLPEEAATVTGGSSGGIVIGLPITAGMRIK